MSDKKKGGKFITSIIIGGALGSVVALAFGRKKCGESGKCKRGILGRILFRKSKK